MSKRRVRLTARLQWQLQASILRRCVPEFIAAHPELDLTVEIPEPAQGATEQVLKALAQGSKQADILDLHTNFEVPIAIKGGLRTALLDMTDRVADLRDQCTGWEPCTWDGRVYGLPSVFSGSAYFYRADAFDRLGIDPTRFGTWDEFIRIGLEVKRTTGAYMLALDTSGFNQIQPLAIHAGGGWFDASGRPMLDCEPTIRALELYRDLLLTHQIAMPTASFYGPEMWQAYRDGRVVGAYMPAWYGANEMRMGLPDMAGQFRVALAPAFDPGDYRGGYRGGMCAVVIRGPDEDIAFELLAFSRLTVRAQLGMLRENFLPPSMFAAYDEPAVKEYAYGFLGGQRVAPVYAELARHTGPFHVGEQLLEVQQLINRVVIPEVTAGKVSARAALADAAASLQRTRVPLEEALKIGGDSNLRRALD
ncbi:MAG TPA: extracellular solute-binding protein [bacterium]|nr:extracellular solute-binding protein [bacterium]